MAHPSEERFLVLHALRMRGFGEPGPIAAVVGLDEEVVAVHLAKLQAEDLVLRRDGRLAGWALKPLGREEQERLAQLDLAAAAAGAVVREGYERFLAVNAELLGVCTDWQVRDGVPNDHADAGYDAAVIGRLRAIDEAIRPVVADLAEALDRYGHYAPRFAAALVRLEAGELEWFTKPLIDSYHTVWFELHEDLLSTLGLERSKEGGVG
jgi:hypothetical protein